MNQFLFTLKELLRGYNQLLLLSCLLFSSCVSYKQNIMFKVSDANAVQQHVEAVEKNYVIQKNDYLQLEVYTNKGERIIDPDLELTKELNTQNPSITKPIPTYLVDMNGVSKFPMVGEIKVEGLKLREAEEVLQKEYSVYYQNSFVILRYVNKRVILLGAPGGQVIPLPNENMRLVEVLALAKGLANDAKAQNIRILRKEQVFVADLSTFDGYLKNNMVIEPGDVIYVEPVRRPFMEGLRDYGAVLSIVTSIATLVVVIIELR